MPMSRLRFARIQSQISLRIAGERAGVPESTLGKWERGCNKFGPPVYALRKLAKLYGCAVDDLLGDMPPIGRPLSPEERLEQEALEGHLAAIGAFDPEKAALIRANGGMLP